MIGRIALLASLVFLAACATRPPISDPAARIAYDANHDPLEPTNRAVFRFNIGFDKAILRPVAVAYRKSLPAPARRGVANFLSNWHLPFVFANELLQAHPGRAAITVQRFAVNTTIGLGGVLDLATKWHLPKHEEDLGQTFAVWGIPDGPYLMLPLLGPSNLRDFTGRIVKVFIEPVKYYLSDNGLSYANYTITAATAVGFRARNLELIDNEAENAVDYYAAVRQAYRQLRCDQIHNGDAHRCEIVQQDVDFPDDFDNRNAGVAN